MAYDRFGRTPAQGRRERFCDWLSILGLGLVLSAAVTLATLLVLVAQ